MPDNLKNTPDTQEFHEYLQDFMKKKEHQHRVKVLQEVASSLSLMIAG